MSNIGPVLSRGSNAAVDCCRHSSLKRVISDKTMIVYARAAIAFRTRAQYGSHDGNIMQYMEHALYQMDMLKSAFRKYRINTRDKDESEHFTFSKFYAIAHYSFACMEPTTGDESCIQMDRQGAFSTDKKHADFQEQIIRHSTRQTNAMAMEDRACILRRCTARIVQVGLRPFWMEPVDTIVCNGVKLKYAPKLVPI